jgi:hypothetical protein
MNESKSQKIIAEKQLREWIRASSEESILTEDYDDAWINAGFGGLIDAWRPLFKTLNLGAQAILGNVITQLRLFTTFNGRKAQQIKDRQKDRNAAFKQELAAIDMPIGPDVAVWALAMNPGAFISLTLANKTREADVVGWLKKAGVGDFAIDELEAGGHVAKRKREEEESGPVAKLLRSLEDIFTLRMGAEDQGNLLIEASSAAEIIGPEILGGEYGAQFKEVQKKLMDSAEELAKEINGVESQIAFLKNLVNISSVEELSSAISELQQMAPDADLGEFKQLPQQLKKDAESMFKDEEAKTEAAKSILIRKGKEEPAEEEIAEVDDSEISKELEGIAFANAVSGFRQGSVEQIKGITQIYEDMMKEMFPPPEGLEAEIWKNSEYGQAVEEIKKRVAALGA